MPYFQYTDYVQRKTTQVSNENGLVQIAGCVPKKRTIFPPKNHNEIQKYNSITIRDKNEIDGKTKNKK